MKELKKDFSIFIPRVWNSHLNLVLLKTFQEIFEPAIKPLVPDAHYSERQDKQFSLPIQWFDVDLNCGFLFFLHTGN